MSSTYASPLDLVERGLDELAAVDPVYRTTGDEKELLLRTTRLISRLECERLRVLPAADDVAETTGGRSTAAWLATQTRDNHGTVRRASALAAQLEVGLDRRGVGCRVVNVAQARVIVESLDALPDELGEDLTVKAEAYLVEQAAVFGPRELHRLGRGVLEHLAPEVADEAEYQRLLAEETRAQAATRLSLTPRRRVHVDG